MSGQQEVQTYVMVEGDPFPNSMEPQTTEFQDAYRRSSGTIIIDMDAARPIAREMIRQARVPHFAENDAATMIATQRNDSEALETTRLRGEALRDATNDPRIEAAETPEDLLAAVAAITGEF